MPPPPAEFAPLAQLARQGRLEEARSLLDRWLNESPDQFARLCIALAPDEPNPAAALAGLEAFQQRLRRAAPDAARDEPTRSEEEPPPRLPEPSPAGEDARDAALAGLVAFQQRLRRAAPDEEAQDEEKAAAEEPPPRLPEPSPAGEDARDAALAGLEAFQRRLRWAAPAEGAAEDREIEPSPAPRLPDPSPAGEDARDAILAGLETFHHALTRDRSDQRVRELESFLQRLNAAAPPLSPEERTLERLELFRAALARPAARRFEEMVS